MKLRLRENSIRLRLLQSEIELLRQSGTVSEKIQFNERRTLTYTLIVSAAEEISSRYEMDEIVIEIPLAQAREWTTTELVGLKNKQTINGNSTLEITLEKDFVCAGRPFDADNRDAFARPSKQNC